MRVILLILVCLSGSLWSQSIDQKLLKENTNTIIIYGSDTCHYCLETKAYLQENKTPFMYFDIDKEELKLQEMLYKMKQKGLSISNVKLPVVDKAGNLFMNDQGFDSFLQLIIKKD